MADSGQQSELTWADIKDFDDAFWKSQQTTLFSTEESKLQ